MQLVMLAAGLGKRFGGCKPLAPVGPGGEALMDITASDASMAGFDSIVLITGPITGPAIRYHVERRWKGKIDVRIARQEVPLGTAHAIVCAGDLLDGQGPFGIVNGDDIYGVDALRTLYEHLSTHNTDCLVAFALRNTITTDAPVTRGICVSDGAGKLSSITERRLISRTADGRYLSDDGLEPSTLDPDVPVSVNLWGFQQDMLAELSAIVNSRRTSLEDGQEILLPEVVADMLAGETQTFGTVGTVSTPQESMTLSDTHVQPDASSLNPKQQVAHTFEMLAGTGRCIGVTHAADLEIVTAMLQSMIATGERPAALWARQCN
ncbi:MAG: NTP transferase domain-containing protein [Actinobacteria bacterium]|nr:NTP transferase domain-containing protein [Actinomycetota bacterium]